MRCGWGLSQAGTGCPGSVPQLVPQTVSTQRAVRWGFGKCWSGSWGAAVAPLPGPLPGAGRGGALREGGEGELGIWAETKGAMWGMVAVQAPDRVRVGEGRMSVCCLWRGARCLAVVRGEAGELGIWAETKGTTWDMVAVEAPDRVRGGEDVRLPPVERGRGASVLRGVRRGNWVFGPRRRGGWGAGAMGRVTEAPEPVRGAPVFGGTGRDDPAPQRFR